MNTWQVKLKLDENEVYFERGLAYYALGIEILKARKYIVFLLIARNYRGARKGEPVAPVPIVMGVQIQKGVLDGK